MSAGDRPVAVKRRWVNGTTGEWLQTSVLVWCPGCDHLHPFRVEAPPGTETWEWDGNLDRPTFSPSMLTVGKSGSRCHSFLRDGRWEFLSDSEHVLAGQTVDVVPLPEWLVSERDDDGREDDEGDQAEAEEDGREAEADDQG